jgi:hypothetical protein
MFLEAYPSIVCGIIKESGGEKADIYETILAGNRI